MKRSSAARGFTLIELMVVVVIVGVLAALAVVGYRKLVNSSHTSEATHMVQAIRVAQESYRAEAGAYANISTSMNGLCPVHAMGTKAPWDPSCNGGSATWSVLAVHADGPVLFKYATMAGKGGTSLPALPTGSTAGSLGGTPANDWFLVSAISDIDGNGVNCVVVGTSWSNQIYVDRESE